MARSYLQTLSRIRVTGIPLLDMIVVVQRAFPNLRIPLRCLRVRSVYALLPNVIELLDAPRRVGMLPVVSVIIEPLCTQIPI